MSAGAFGWEQALALMAEACAEAPNERRVLLVLADRSYHVSEVLSRQAPSEGGLLGLVVWQDDPDLTQRTQQTTLLLLRPEQVVRIEVHGFDGRDRTFGFC